MTRGRIDAVIVTPLAFADPPLLNADGVHEPHVLRALVEIVVDDGRGRQVSGFGECAGHAWQLDWLELTAGRLVGSSVFDTVGLAREVTAALSGVGVDTAADASWRRWSDRSPAESLGPAPIPAGDFDRRRVFSALEVAFLDATGRLLDLPVVDLLGGARRPVVDYAGYLFYKLAGHPDADGAVRPDRWGPALNAAGIVEQARRMVDEYGFRSLKLKGGVFAPELEIDALEGLRRAFPAHALRIDPNAAWSVQTTLEQLPRLDGLVEYLEDPVAGREGMAEVAAATGIPLATNMCVTAWQHIPESLRLGSVSVILADHHYWDGIRGVMALDAVCRTTGLGLSMHSNSHLGVSLAAMTHAAAASEIRYACDTHYPWNRAEDIVVAGALEIEDGAVRVPAGAGLGVEIDRHAVARLAERYLSLGREHRRDQRYAEAIGVTTVTGALPRW